MHSDDETPTQNDTLSQVHDRAVLRREVPVPERQRISVVAGALSLAGVVLGFGLAHISSANTNCAHSVVVHPQPHVAERTIIQPSFSAPVEAKLTWLGVRVESGPGMPAGAHVTDVFPGSPAAAAGLTSGHRIVGFERAPVHSAGGLIENVRMHEPGEEIVVHAVDESGTEESFSVVLDSISPREFRRLRSGR